MATNDSIRLLQSFLSPFYNISFAAVMSQFFFSTLSIHCTLSARECGVLSSGLTSRLPPQRRMHPWIVSENNPVTASHHGTVTVKKSMPMPMSAGLEITSHTSAAMPLTSLTVTA